MHKNPPIPAPLAYTLIQIFIFIGFLEFLGLKIKENPTYAPGDLLGASELVDNTDAGWVDYQQKELNNGRLAMVSSPPRVSARPRLGGGVGACAHACMVFCCLLQSRPSYRHRPHRDQLDVYRATRDAQLHFT